MSESHTLATLKAALQAWEEESTAEFVANLDLIIQRGELKLLRDLDLSIFDAEEDKDTVGANEELTKPDDILVARSLSYVASGERIFLQERTLDFVRDYGQAGNPLYYAEKTELVWALAPVSAGVTTVKVHYIKRPASLVTDTDGTFLSERFGDALFYACIASADEFLQADERLQLWKGRYDTEVLPMAKREAARLTRSDYMRQYGGGGR